MDDQLVALATDLSQNRAPQIVGSLDQALLQNDADDQQLHMLPACHRPPGPKGQKVFHRLIDHPSMAASCDKQNDTVISYHALSTLEG
jgi:hypothetical protein